MVGSILSGLAVVSNPFDRDPNALTADERIVVAALHEIFAAEERFRRAAAVDADGDGHGEFGFLGELAGSARLRIDRFGNLGTGTLLDAELPIEFTLIVDGTATLHDYHIQLLLPANDGSWIEESEEGGGAKTTVDPDLAEQGFCAVAWPTLTSPGQHAFFLDPRGRVSMSGPGIDEQRLRGLAQRPAADSDLPASELGGGRRGAVGGRIWLLLEN